VSGNGPGSPEFEKTVRVKKKSYLADTMCPVILRGHNLSRGLVPKQIASVLVGFRTRPLWMNQL